MPSRNRANLIHRAIQSVLTQSFSDLELIVVNDCSTDDTREVVARIARTDSRVRVIDRVRPGGAAAARNEGAARAHGEFLAFLDDDDEYLPYKLEHQVRALDSARESVGLIYGPCLFVDAEKHERLLEIPPDVKTVSPRREILRRNFISTPAVLVRRTIFERVGGFDASLPRLQDWDLWIRIAAESDFIYDPSPPARAHYTALSISTHPQALRDAVRILMQKLQSRRDLSAVELAEVEYAMGHILMIGGAPADGPRFLRRSVRIRPWPPQRLLMAGLSMLGPRPYCWVSRLHARRAHQHHRAV